MSGAENEVKEDGEGATALKRVLSCTYRARALWYAPGAAGPIDTNLSDFRKSNF